MRTFFLALIPFFLLTSFTVQDNSDAILGNWMTVENNLKVHVYKENGEYRARIVWFNDKGYKAPMNDCLDDQNPDPKLRNRKLIGLQVLNGLHYVTDDNEWEDGRIYDPNSGDTYDSVVWMEDGVLKVRGYVLFEWLGKTLEFKRVP